MTMTEPTVSALLPVHLGADARHLEACLESLLVQTRSLDEIVVVEDGPVGDQKDKILHDLEQRHDRVVRVRLATNQGAGVANQAGLEAATGEWVAKADADDISLPARIETQLRAVTAAHADVCGAAMFEFVGQQDEVVSIRSMPATHPEIVRRMRWNSPINHPTAFFRRETALQVGGYPPWRNMQDYGLFARMCAGGARMMNVHEPQVLFRSGAGVTARRRSTAIRRLEWELQRELRRKGIVSSPRMFVNMAWRSAFRMLPPSAVQFASHRVLASPTSGSGAE